jgi:hypothetical protein
MKKIIYILTAILTLSSISGHTLEYETMVSLQNFNSFESKVWESKRYIKEIRAMNDFLVIVKISD